MEILWWALGILGAAAVLALLISLYCYFRVFYSPKRKPLGNEEFEIPFGGEYEAIKEQIKTWVRAARTMPHEELEMKSRDGLTLRARYYENKKGAPVEILIHGYRGNGERDMSGGIARAFALGRNALVIDHRASGRSDGHTITFGIKERLDCVDWARFAAEKFDTGTPIILCGISMGGATVAMASADPSLPDSVKCALCDCPYSSAREIIMKVIRDMKLPPRLVYPFVKLGALIFGGFNPDSYSPIEAVKDARIPITYIHGAADTFVPAYMSEMLHAATKSESRILLVEGADHGLAYPTDMDGYLKFLDESQRDYLK
ncbi:MAG: alpha/beta hydrolase [Clostridia bacterium]|nr:alpha/beta hydrolase [Clostridia bacterium]